MRRYWPWAGMGHPSGWGLPRAAADPKAVGGLWPTLGSLPARSRSQSLGDLPRAVMGHPSSWGLPRAVADPKAVGVGVGNPGCLGSLCSIPTLPGFTARSEPIPKLPGSAAGRHGTPIWLGLPLSVVAGPKAAGHCTVNPGGLQNGRHNGRQNGRHNGRLKWMATSRLAHCRAPDVY